MYFFLPFSSFPFWVFFSCCLRIHGTSVARHSTPSGAAWPWHSALLKTYPPPQCCGTSPTMPCAAFPAQLCGARAHLGQSGNGGANKYMPRGTMDVSGGDAFCKLAAGEILLPMSHCTNTLLDVCQCAPERPPLSSPHTHCGKPFSILTTCS